MFAKVAARKIILEMKFLFLMLLLAQFSLLPIQVLFSSSASVGSPDRFEKFSNSMKGVRFTGFFTVDGSDRPPAEETYEIQSVQKFGQDDLWIFTARIKYGKKDVTLPMPLPVKWLGDVPVISMKDLNIPGLGTFSAHVIIDGPKYAGTWAHGKVGGHLYGKISKIEEKK